MQLGWFAKEFAIMMSDAHGTLPHLFWAKVSWGLGSPMRRTVTSEVPARRSLMRQSYKLFGRFSTPAVYRPPDRGTRGPKNVQAKGTSMKPTVLLFTMSVLLLFSPNATRAQGKSDKPETLPPIDLSQVALKKTVDLRADKSSSNWRMVILLARQGVPGHAYVAAASFREDSESFVTDSVFGLYPKNDKWGIWEVPGGPELDKKDSKPDVALIIWTNPAQHAQAIATRERYTAEGKYQLVAKDCVSLISDVADILGLNKPPLALLPYPFVKGLLERN